MFVSVGYLNVFTQVVLVSLFLSGTPCHTSRAGLGRVQISERNMELQLVKIILTLSIRALS
eukprot:1568121-Amphidinium_carterae.3